jgi:hypothetical protein
VCTHSRHEAILDFSSKVDTVIDGTLLSFIRLFRGEEYMDLGVMFKHMNNLTFTRFIDLISHLEHLYVYYKVQC